MGRYKMVEINIIAISLGNLNVADCGICGVLESSALDAEGQLLHYYFQ